ncbi:MAG: hypothetical protein PHV23_03895 [Candidatus Gracilibacteria bacterium]|nr:hypothetical protein [Candidatus Gracilibacteria bacterium]
MLEKDIKPNVSTDDKSTNIFDEFSTDSSLVDEVEKLKDEANKDLFYYLSILGKVFQKLFILFIIGFIVSYSYIYIQKSETFSDNSLIDPICSIFVDTSIGKPDGTTYCSSITFTKVFYEDLLNKTKLEQTKKIFGNIIQIYEENNFTKTKELVFLLDKTEYRLSILNVIEKFDLLKNDFGGIDKSKIQCDGLKIHTDTNILEMNCTAYSKGYENGIIGFSGRKNETEETGGTSISIANSFLNYIEKNSKDFVLIDKQKVFNISSISSETNGYTNKTSFGVKLKINF